MGRKLRITAAALLAVLSTACYSDPTAVWPGDPAAVTVDHYADIEAVGLYTRADLADSRKGLAFALASEAVQTAYHDLDKPGADVVDDCLDHVMFYVMEDDLFYDLTDSGPETSGAAWYDWTVDVYGHDEYPIYIKESNFNDSNPMQTVVIFVHELTHVATYCTGGTSGAHDTDYFWNEWEQPNKEQTVEWYADSIMEHQMAWLNLHGAPVTE